MDVEVKLRAPPGSADVMAASGREHLGTVLFGLWMTAGLFLDGYFHQNLDTDGESFLTTWHAVFYAGFTASALWLAAMSRRRSGGGPASAGASPKCAGLLRTCTTLRLLTESLR